MNIFKTSLALLALAIMPLMAQNGPAPDQSPKATSAQDVAELSSCNAKGCPKLDQNGKPPTSCQYTSGMATAWNCILICTYPMSNWGTKVDSSNCN